MSAAQFTCWRLLLYVSTVLAIEFAREFSLVGTEKIRNYDWVDWMVLLVTVWSVAGVTVKAYFDNGQPKNGTGNTERLVKPPS